MSLQNINDPQGVKALLDTLRNSQAWAETVGPSSRAAVQVEPTAAAAAQPRDRAVALSSGPSPGYAGPTITPSSFSGNDDDDSDPSKNNGTTTPAGRPSVAYLLSQLRASPHGQGLLGLERPATTADAVWEDDDRIPEWGSPPPTQDQDASPVSVPVPVPQSVSTHASTKSQQHDVRTLSFQQALPHISRLMEDPHVAETLSKMKEEQDKLEKRLWEEREGIRKSHEEKVKVAKTKAKMIGVGLSEQEAQMLSDGFRKELGKFDTERALPAWDGLLRGQQARLEALKVPTMFVTSETGDVEKQRRVVQVLEGILSTSDPAQ